MNATVERPAVGAVMIYRKDYGTEPVTVNVCKVSKSGWVKFTHEDGSESSWYKRDGDGYERQSQSRFSRTRSRLWPFSEEKMTQLREEAGRQKVIQDEKAAAEQKRRDEREERLASELAAVKAALNGDWRTALLHDGPVGDDPEDRVLMIRLPVRPDMVERQGTSQVAVLRVRKEEKSWLNADEQWTAAPACANKATSSWSSISPERGPDAETAIWNALRYLYNMMQ